MQPQSFYNDEPEERELTEDDELPDDVCPGCGGSCEYVVSYMPDGSPVWAPCITCMASGAY